MRKIPRKFIKILIILNIYCATSHASVMVDDLQSGNKSGLKKTSRLLRLKKYYVNSPPLGVFTKKTSSHAIASVRIKKNFCNLASSVDGLLKNKDCLCQQTLLGDHDEELMEEVKIFDAVADEQVDFIEVYRKIDNTENHNFIKTANDEMEKDSDNDDFVLIDCNDKPSLSDQLKLEKLLRNAT